MASATHSAHFGVHADRATPFAVAVGARLKGLARLLADVLEERRRRDADAVIARLMAQSGGRMTDSLEREITQKVLGAGWSLPL